MAGNVFCHRPGERLGAGAATAMKAQSALHKGFDSTQVDVGREACSRGKMWVAGMKGLMTGWVQGLQQCAVGCGERGLEGDKGGWGGGGWVQGLR